MHRYILLALTLALSNAVQIASEDAPPAFTNYAQIASEDAPAPFITQTGPANNSSDWTERFGSGSG